MKTIIVLIALSGVTAIALKWAFLPAFPYRRLPRHRVRYFRLRLHLRLHPGRGHATLAELWLRWGRLARSAAAAGPGPCCPSGSASSARLAPTRY